MLESLKAFWAVLFRRAVPVTGCDEWLNLHYSFQLDWYLPMDNGLSSVEPPAVKD